MTRPERRLARPIYEALPWLYMLCGLAALVASYVQTSSWLSALLGVPGFIAFLGGIVLVLRRRDYRRMRAQYSQPDADALAQPPPRDQKPL